MVQGLFRRWTIIQWIGWIADIGIGGTIRIPVSPVGASDACGVVGHLLYGKLIEIQNSFKEKEYGAMAMAVQGAVDLWRREFDEFSVSWTLQRERKYVIQRFIGYVLCLLCFLCENAGLFMVDYAIIISVWNWYNNLVSNWNNYLVSNYDNKNSFKLNNNSVSVAIYASYIYMIWSHDYIYVYIEILIIYIWSHDYIYHRPSVITTKNRTS